MTTAREEATAAEATPQQPRAPRRRDKRLIARLTPPRRFVQHWLLAIEGIWAVGSLAHLVGAPPWWFPIGGGGVAVVGSLFALWRSRRRSVGLFVAVASALAGVAVAVVAVYGPGSVVTASSLLAYTIVLGPSYWVMRRRHEWRLEAEVLRQEAERLRQEEELQREVAEQRRREVARALAKRRKWEEILAAAGATDVHIDAMVNDGPWRAGERTFEAGFALALILGDEAPEPEKLAKLLAKIERIARNRLRLPIVPGSVQLLPRGYANEMELIVATRNLLKEVRRVVIEPRPLTVNGALECYTAIDGSRIGWNPMKDPHGMVAGRNDAGKSTLLKAHLVKLTQCVDGVPWMICGAKAVRAFAPWMQAWLRGTRSATSPTGWVEPVIDWIAADIEEAGRMMCDAYKAVSIREASAAGSLDDKWVPNPRQPRLVIVIEEASNFLTNDEYLVKPYDWAGPSDEEDEKKGKRTGLTFAQLVLKVLTLGRGEAVSVLLATLRVTKALSGDDAPTMKTQVTYRVGMAQGGNDRTATFNTHSAGVQLARLEQGQAYVELNGYYQPIKAKGDLVELEDVIHASVEHTQYSLPLDNYTAQGLDHYAGRWTRPGQQAFLRRLILEPPARTVPWVPAPGVVLSATSSVVALDRALPGVVAQAAGDLAGGATAVPVAAVQLIQLTGDELVAEMERLFARSGEEPYGDDEPGDSGGDEPPQDPPREPRLVFDPELDEDARDLLQLLAQSGLLYGEWVLSREILPLAMRHLGWAAEKPGYERIKAALGKVGVNQPNRIKRENKRLGQGYYVADIQAALERVSRWEE